MPIETIKSYLSKLPELPGVYKMLGAKGEVLYIGKAKNLRKRVVSYTQPERLSCRIHAMVSKVEKVEFVTTKNEVEALLLEANLIKKHEPRYNIMLKDDKSFPYILLTGHEYPMIAKYRGSKARKGDYYGPFASVSDIYKTIAVLQKTFLLRTCSDNVFAQRKRPCLEYQIKRCSAPCVNKISRKDYQDLVNQAKDFFSGKSSNIQKKLIKEMEIASKNLEYEKAASLRDRIKALTQVQINQANIPGLENADVIGVYLDGGNCCIQISFFRGGQHFGSRSYFPVHTEDSVSAEITSAFLGRFYQDNPPPEQIITSAEVEDKEVIEVALTGIAKSKITIETPKRGKKLDLVEHTIKEAKTALIRRLDEKLAQDTILIQLADKFGLDEPPKRIEIFDNSHIMGTNQVGAMVVAGTEGFIKNSYRRFNITKSTIPGDDYAMLAEVLTRRYGGLKREYIDNISVWPDLVLIDGGAGHLKIAEQVFANLGITDIPFVCIAKGVDRNAGNETFFIPGKKPFKLPKNDPVLFYLQRLRDEAHRFVIMSHRKKRGKTTTKSGLDKIPGIGPARKKSLLSYFGSLEAVKQAGMEDLERVPGISKEIAKTVWRGLRK